MALNFPLTPSYGQTYSNNGKDWIYNGIAWDAVNIQSSGPQGVQGLQGAGGVQGNAGPTGSGLNDGDPIKFLSGLTALSFQTTTISVYGNFLPSENFTYDLGSTVSRWKTLFVQDVISSSQSIFLGDLKLSNENGELRIQNMSNNGLDVGIKGVTQGTGPQGFQGPSGYGTQGDTGPQGLAGSNGSAGSQGNQGSIGPQGLFGYGETGNQGAIGPQGSPGPQGSGGGGGGSTNALSRYIIKGKQTIPDGTETVIVWESSDGGNSIGTTGLIYDPGDISYAGRFINDSGSTAVYNVSGHVSTDGSFMTGNNKFWLYGVKNQNGLFSVEPNIYSLSDHSDPTGGDSLIGTSRIFNFNILLSYTDYFDIRIYQETGSDIDIPYDGFMNPNLPGCRITIVKLG